MKPKAVGFLHRDVSGTQQDAHEKSLQATADAKRIDLARIFACSHLVKNPPLRLTIMLGNIDADTIIVPHPMGAHLGKAAAELNQTYTIIETPLFAGDEATVWEPHSMMAGAR